jgi:two-component system, chemotaxis family, response regulator Rcp1
VEVAARTILLVEDSPADVYLIRQAVADCGHDIQLAIVPDGGEALAFLRKEPPFTQAFTPALILLDFNLPRVNGNQVLTELRRLPSYQATPVVVFSSAPKDLVELLCFCLGATEYVQKPHVLDDFFATVRSLITKWLPPGSS